MDAKDKWNIIAADYAQMRLAGENAVQAKWELYCSELLGYSRLRQEIRPQERMRLGSHDRLIADIAIYVDSDLKFIFELKKYNKTLDRGIEEQLISYLKQSNCEVGVLIYDHVCVVVYDYAKNKAKSLEIEFTTDNHDGIELIRHFQKHDFDRNSIEKWIDDKCQHAESIKMIQSELDENGTTLIQELLITHYLKSFSKNEILEAIQNYEIKCARRNIIQPLLLSHPEPVLQTHMMTRAQARELFKKNGYDIHPRYTFASKNSTLDVYWANPDISFLKNNWSLVLNDQLNRTLYLFDIGANSIARGELKERKDRDFINMNIIYGDGQFRDRDTGVSFSRFLTATLNY